MGSIPITCFLSPEVDPSGLFVRLFFQERLGVLAAACTVPGRHLLRSVCDPPCLSMRNNAPVEHCAAEALISDAGLYPTSEKSFTLRIHLTIEITRILRQRLKSRLLRYEKNRCLTLRIISAKAPEFFIWRSLSSYSDNLTLISQIPVRQIHIFKIHLLRTQLSRTHLFQNQLLHIHQSQSRQTHSPH